MVGILAKNIWNNQIPSFLWIWSHLLKKSLMENIIFCGMYFCVKKQSSKIHLLSSFEDHIVMCTHPTAIGYDKWPLPNALWTIF